MALAAALSIKPARLGPLAVTTVTAYFAVLCTTQGEAASPPLTSSDKEAQKLFAVVLKRERPPGRCQYDAEWSREELPDYVAKLEFHLAVKAGLVPPSVTGGLREILDPDHRIDASAFCSPEDLKTYTAQRVAEFEKGSESNMQIDRTLFGYPIFNRSRTKAVIVVTRAGLDGRSRLNGRIGRHPADVGIQAAIYRKVGGYWRFVKSTFFSVS